MAFEYYFVMALAQYHGRSRSTQTENKFGTVIV